jgi:hypothetical protein
MTGRKQNYLHRERIEILRSPDRFVFDQKKAESYLNYLSDLSFYARRIYPKLQHLNSSLNARYSSIGCFKFIVDDVFFWEFILQWFVPTCGPIILNAIFIIVRNADSTVGFIIYSLLSVFFFAAYFAAWTALSSLFYRSAIQRYAGYIENFSQPELAKLDICKAQVSGNNFEVVFTDCQKWRISEEEYEYYIKNNNPEFIYRIRNGIEIIDNNKVNRTPEDLIENIKRTNRFSNLVLSEAAANIP